ncbi:MAG: hypothetical protein MJZ26_14845 [Fibrobacter sp.]|nr:hypothetical protein [Fibrobacter sp.]
MDNEILHTDPDNSGEEKPKKKAKHLWCIDLDSLKKETGMTIEELAAIADYSNPKGVYNWDKEFGSRPSYNTFIELFKAGATVETLFGVEYKASGKINDVPADVRDIARQMLIDSMSQTLEKLKSDGPKPPQK